MRYTIDKGITSSTSRNRLRALLIALSLALAAPTVAIATEAAKHFSLESTIGELLANAKTKAIIDKNLPGLSTSPQLSMIQGMSLQTVAGFPQANIDATKLKAIGEELAKVND